MADLQFFTDMIDLISLMGLKDLFTPVKYSVSPHTYRFSGRAKLVTIWLLAILSLSVILYSWHIIPVFLWAAVAAYICNPLISFVSEKTRAPKALTILTFYALVIFVAVWAATSVAPMISYELSELSTGTPGSNTIVDKISSFGSINLLGAEINAAQVMSSMSSWFLSQVPSHALPIVFGALERVLLTFVFFVITFYFLLEAGKWRDAIENMIPEPYREEIADLIERIDLTLGAYIRAQIVLITIMSTASFLVLFVLKVKFALILSLMTGILEVIPIVGPIGATAIVATVALLQTTAPFGMSNQILAIIVIVAYVILRQLEDYLIIPNVAARFVKVHPVAGIFALLIGGSIGGVMGLFLAIPAVAVLKVFLSYLYRKLIS